MTQDTPYSNAWLRGALASTDYDGDNRSSVGAKAMAYAASLRAVRNFVAILTGDSSIKVKYMANDGGSTDGKTVWIGGNATKPKDFDHIVGLALHEASHVKKTDFDVIKALVYEGATTIPTDLINLVAKKYALTTQQAVDMLIPRLKSLQNTIEDRRIDRWVYTTAPGYIGYYTSLYNKFFNSPLVDKMLQSASYRDETFESYDVRMMNLTNKHSDLTALKGLQQIFDLIDLRNISRFKNTQEVLELTFAVYRIMESYFPDPTNDPDEQDESEDESEDGDGDESENDTNGNSNGGDGDDSEDDNDGDSSDSDDKDSDSDDSNGQGSGNESDKGDNDNEHNITNGNGRPLTEKELEKLLEAIEKQKEFSDGNVNKKELAKATAKAVEAIEESKVDSTPTGGEVGENVGAKRGNGFNENAAYNVGKIDTIVIQNFNLKYCESDPFRVLQQRPNNNLSEIKEGTRLGKMLGNKLQVRNDERTTTHTRLRKGRLDKRLISGCGFGQEGVFYQTDVDFYNPALTHMSIDGSGSMSGAEWNQTMVAVVAIAKAATLVKNLDVVIDFRFTTNQGLSGKHQPLVLIAYDSRKDKFTKIQKLFPYLGVSGTTPEGLCFEAVNKLMKDLTPKGTDKYFINFSDGMPGFSSNGISYHGNGAVEHTRREVNKIRKDGAEVLSFLIGGRSANTFRRMYGKDAKTIDVTRIVPLAKALNNMFLKK